MFLLCNGREVSSLDARSSTPAGSSEDYSAIVIAANAILACLRQTEERAFEDDKSREVDRRWEMGH